MVDAHEGDDLPTINLVPRPSNRGIVVFSGGSAANSLVEVFDAVRTSKDCPLSYIIPISDNGGSSSELIRVFGGPGIGDVRSRLVRLIPSHPPSTERSAIAALFNHRLSSTCANQAAAEWHTIVSGTNSLWQAIPSAKKELIRAFFNLLNLEILKRSRPPTSTFDFTSASVGNLFLTGARLFSGSFESAIYLLGSICGIPDDVHVIPAINSNFSHHISAGLENGEIIVGQNSISHPSISTALEPPGNSPTSARSRYSIGFAPNVEDANLPGSLPSLRKQNIAFSKDEDEPLPARIARIWYINPYGQEILPPANARVIEAIRDSQAIIYSIGSLYTSIIPSIVLHGVGDAIGTAPARHKILILNGSLDREVGPDPYTALDFVDAIVRAAEDSSPPLRKAESKPEIYKRYVTHLIYLVGEGTPFVDRGRLREFGIDALKVYGRKVGSHMRYDDQALAGAIETILGRKGDAVILSKSRRNTMDP
jgi:2-phospho-L-lactate transferase/gluconeogenesis factor (CofD/UPF0052 family)